MNTAQTNLLSAIAPLRQQIIDHPVYMVLDTVEDLHVFMEYHVYAVWDFMSLLKALQNRLTCTKVPWFPMKSAASVHLINEIVSGEESDVDANGKRVSHYEMYLDAMRQCGADVSGITTFTQVLRDTGSFEDAYLMAETPLEARNFVNFTFEVIRSEKEHLQAAIFTYGREDLIPSMFLSLVGDLAAEFPEKIAGFKYYLERHIELDGEHHSQLALEMVARLCDKSSISWLEAQYMATAALEHRINLWNGAYDAIVSRRRLGHGQL